MKVLLTGATGYIGKRLLPILINRGHQVVCCVRDLSRYNPPSSLVGNIEVVEVDMLKPSTLKNIPKDIEGAYYLIHSMSSSDNYDELEKESAVNFRNYLNETSVKHVVYLSGIVNNSSLSKHLSSRLVVEKELSKGRYSCTTLRAGIVIGSGSASFEIIRDIVEKLPVMVTPKWLNTKCQPIGISDVLFFLSNTLFNPAVFDQDFDIGGPNVLSYKEMLLSFARIRGLKRRIYTVPVMTPKLSSYWLYFVTSTSYKLAVSLVHSMKVEVVCRDNKLAELLGRKTLTYDAAIKAAFSKIETNQIASSWKDAFTSSDFEFSISDAINVPSHGCFTDKRKNVVANREATIEKVWGIGGQNGWYYGNWLWQIRGVLDKFVGGVGLRRGRTSLDSLNSGDALDFWRVLYANKQEGRLLLYAEMKLPGEAWLEFKVEGQELIQTATFRPLGLWGRFYWFLVLPFHGLIFKGMLNQLTTARA